MTRLTTMSGRLTHLAKLGRVDYATIDRLAGLTSKGHTGHIARGELRNPTVLVAVPIARVLGTTVEWLLDGSEDAAPSERKVRAAVRAARERLDAGHVAKVTARARKRKVNRRAGRRPDAHSGEGAR